MPVETDSLLERRYRVLWAQLAAVLRQAFATWRARRGRVVVRRSTAEALPGRLQQCAARRALPPACGCGARPAGSRAEYPYALSRRERGGLCRAAHVPVRSMSSMAMFCCTWQQKRMSLRLRIACAIAAASRGIISTAWAYHGNTAAVMQVKLCCSPRGPARPEYSTHGAGDGPLPRPRGAQRRGTRDRLRGGSKTGDRLVRRGRCSLCRPPVLHRLLQRRSADGARRIHGQSARTRARRRRILHCG